MKVIQIKVDELRLEGSNVRNRYSARGLEELKASVLQHGVCVPLLVKALENGYAVLDGGRRLSVAFECGIERLPCVVLDEAGDKQAALAWVTNFERESVPFYEESAFFGRCLGDCGWSVEELSLLLNRSVGYVRSRLAVLEWPPSLLEYCRASGVSYSVAREYARLGVSPELELALDWERINQPSYRQAVAYVDEILRAREIVVPPEAVLPVVAPLVCVCDVCRGERDPRTSRTLMACASCVAEIEKAHQPEEIEAKPGQSPLGAPPRRGKGAKDGKTGAAAAN